MIAEHNAIKFGIKSNDVIKILATKLIAMQNTSNI